MHHPEGVETWDGVILGKWVTCTLSNILKGWLCKWTVSFVGAYDRSEWGSAKHSLMRLLDVLYPTTRQSF